MDTVIETQAAPEPAAQAPMPGKKPFLRRMAKWAAYLLLALIVGGLIAIGYTQHWFTSGAGKAKDILGATTQVPGVSAQAPGAAPTGDGLAHARQAFAAGDLQGAIKAYQALLTSNPQDINAMGELGNVYYRAGWIPQATQTYFDTASKALDQNRPDVAQTLVSVIEQTNPMLASQLHDRLFEVESQQMDAQMQSQMRDGPPQQAQSEAMQATPPQGQAFRPHQG
jgi:hypothetical protein